VKRSDLAPLIKDIGERQLQRELSKLIGMRLLFETGKTSDRCYYRYNPNESSDTNMS
jgi:hypothetical protein